MKLCMSSVLDRQLKERSRCRSAGQPERGGNRSMLPNVRKHRANSGINQKQSALDMAKALPIIG